MKNRVNIPANTEEIATFYIFSNLGELYDISLNKNLLETHNG